MTITVFVRHYLNDAGLDYFDQHWFPYVESKISQQKGFVSIAYQKDVQDPSCRRITVVFESQATVEAWAAHDDHQAVLYDLDKYRVGNWHYKMVEGEAAVPPASLDDWDRVDVGF